jgi:hypothetical protein
MGILAAKVTALLAMAKKLNPPVSAAVTTGLTKLAKDVADFEAKFDVAKKAQELATKSEEAAKKECGEAHKAANVILNLNDMKGVGANSPLAPIVKDLKAVADGLNKKLLGLK